ncbi:glycosyltransferase [Ferruginibacter lapsinanis]|uniref:glycosyltransferase family 2 protein n=1 Tax=Ferruginibacter lapsinanis TaxID=563172 RepID=UPI001E2B1053|nr:glycosyltransferase family 2 protein [Ferruginibacter lapsinanis]UEG50560.1 glycosyltransferase [Ferruginibacter lapsinanis]
MHQPLISIISINYNNKPGLANTIESVLKQSFKDYEYLIIDGLSDDGSKELIQQNEQYLSYWISEKDNGVYDAMNKGILQAKGRYLFFLNSGDCLASSDVLERVSVGMNQGDHDIVYGDFIYDNKIVTYKPVLSLYYVLTQGMCHQTQFLKKALFDKAGLYNPIYRVTADHCQLILFLVKYNASYIHVNVPVSVIELGGMSSVSIANNQKERMQFMQTEFPLLVQDYISLKKYKKLNIVERAKNLFIRKFSSKG